MLFLRSSETLCAGTTPCINAAATTSDLARASKRCSNWPGLRGDLEYLMQGAVGFNQRVYRNLAFDAMLLGFFLDVGDHFTDLCCLGRLGDGDVGEDIAQTFHQDIYILLPGRVRVIVDAHSCHLEFVDLRLLHADYHLRMFALLPGGGAVFTITGDVEYRPQLILNLHRFEHELLATGEVLTGGNHGEGFFSFEQGKVWMYESVQEAILFNGVASGRCNPDPEPRWGDSCFDHF